MSEHLVAKLVGEGVGRPEAALPIDINYAKLGEWLVSSCGTPCLSGSSIFTRRSQYGPGRRTDTQTILMLRPDY